MFKVLNKDYPKEERFYVRRYERFLVFFLSFWSQSPLSCPSTALSYCFQMGESERPRFGCKATHLFWSMLIGLVLIIIITDKWQDLPVSIKVSLSMLSFSSPHIGWLASACYLTKIPSEVFSFVWVPLQYTFWLIWIWHKCLSYVHACHHLLKMSKITSPCVRGNETPLSFSCSTWSYCRGARLLFLTRANKTPQR